MDADSPAGLGSLSVLPFEIRDLIYRHVFSDRYCYRLLSSPIGLLGASKALRHEATDTLYSHSTFKFELNSGAFALKYTLLGPSQEVVNLLNHVEVFLPLDIESYDIFRRNNDLDVFNKNVISKLASANRARKTCRIVFPKSGYQSIQWCRFPFSEDLRRLSSFKVVVFELECGPYDFEFMKVPPNMIRYWRGDRTHMFYVSAMENRRTQLRSYLGDTLGDCRSYMKGNLRCLEFRPRSY